jgi:hypothetical protein
MPLDLRRPVAGFSITHVFGSKYAMIRRVRRTMESAVSKSLTRDVIAMEYSVHGGAAKMVSKYPGG